MDDDVAQMLDNLGEAEARRLLDRLGLRASLREFERRCAIVFAMDLHRRRIPRRQIIERLMTRYGFSERKAYMVDNSAIAEFCKSGVGFAKNSGIVDAPITNKDCSQ